LGPKKNGNSEAQVLYMGWARPGLRQA